MMECVNSTGIRCGGSVMSNRCVELLYEGWICKDQKNQLGAAEVEVEEKKSEWHCMKFF